MGNSVFTNMRYSGLSAQYWQHVNTEFNAVPDLVATSGVGNSISQTAKNLVDVYGTDAGGNWIHFSQAGAGPQNSGYYLESNVVKWFKGAYATWQTAMDAGALPSGQSYVTYPVSGNNPFYFIASSKIGDAVGGYIQSDGTALNWQNGVPGPDPWGTMYSIKQSRFFDLTLDINQYRFYDGHPAAYIYLRANFNPNADDFATNAYTFIVDSNYGTNDGYMAWGDNIATRKLIYGTDVGVVIGTSGTIRLLLDENHTLSAWWNGVYLGNYDYSIGYTNPNSVGSWGMLCYGGWTQKFNSYTLKTDRLDNAF